jgi:hypothetical protein
VVYLIATDQNKDAVGEFSQGDTVHFATVISRILPGKYTLGRTASLIQKVEIIKVGESIVYLDSMFEHFNALLKIKKYAPLKEFDEIHILNQGGIDAINYGLLLNALYLYGNKTRLYTVNEQLGLCNPMNFGTQFVLEQQKMQLLQAIQRYDYSFAKTLQLETDISLWAGYAEARLNFDFDAAHERLSHLSTKLRDKQVQELSDLKNTRANADSLTAELYWNAIIRYEQEAYVDFVQRFFRIIEQYAQTKALFYLKKFDYDPKEHTKWEEKFTAFLALPENNGLQNHLSAKKVGPYSLTITKPSIPLFMNIIEYFNKKEYDFVNALTPLSQLRNKGIGAHGFEPVSIKQILNKLNVSRPEFEKMLQKVGKKLKAGENPFIRINRIITDLL